MASESLQPGMIIAEPVMNNYGAVVAWQDTVLDDTLIRRIISMGIPHLLVCSAEIFEIGAEQQDEWKISRTAEAFRRDYQRETESFRVMFSKVSSGGLVEKQTTEQIVDSIIEKHQDSGQIIDCIRQLRSADEYTYHHSVNVSMLAMMTAKWMRVPENELKEIVRAGLLHDVGKSRVPLSILNKPGPLDAAEYKEMKKHSEYGYQLLRLSPDIKTEVASAVLTHHERDDGTGYPLGIRADKLGISAKILAIVDIFDAMTANRVYRPHEPVFRVFSQMQHGSFGQLDPIVLQVFLSHLTHYYVGKKVRLSNGVEAEVVFMNRNDFSRPLLQTSSGFVDMMTEKQLEILEVL